MTLTEQLIDKEKQVSAHNYSPLPVVMSRANGVWMYDVEGKKYLDMLSAYSAVSHGHCHPRMVKVLHEQSQKLCLSSRAFYTEVLGPFLEKLCSVSKMDQALPMNSGAEAVETAIKGARRWGYQIKRIPENLAEIIVCERNFHGRTSGIISFSSEPSYKKGFGPFMPGFKTIPYSDAKALKEAITPNTCAFLVEPVQGEGGIYVPSPGWLKEVEKICRENRVLLIVDEIQSGLGRTGKWFASNYEDIQPDGMTIGKALGGGVFPISALVGKKELMDVFTPGSHGSTWGGNALAAAVGLEALTILEEEHLIERSAKLGIHLLSRLKGLKSPLIKEVRGIGLWAGVEIDPQKARARTICEMLVKRGVLSKETHETVIRFAPPLVIEQSEIDWGIEQLTWVLENYKPENS